ncbi:MAG: pitrilysin family protein [Bacteroidota bacterium]|nr:pitrilysin family protein [Bacteroidota bacterium]
MTLTLLLLLCSAALLRAQEYRPTYDLFTLENGLTVILHGDSTLPLLSMNMAYRAGSSRDPAGKTGIANIAGEMLLTGTKRVPREELLRLRETEGVSIQAQTSVDWLNIASVFPAGMLEDAIRIEADRMKNAEESVSMEIFNAMTGALKREHARRQKKALGTLMQQIYHELYAEGHPYRHSTIGEEGDIDTLAIDDVRRFMQSFYTPSNASLTISGDFDAAAVRELVKNHFGDIPAGRPSRWKNIPDTFQPIGQGAFIREDRMEFNQLHLIFPTVRYGHTDDAVLHILANVLNGSAHAVLQQGMVSVNPAVLRAEVYQSTHEIGGNFWISITVTPEAKLQPLYGQIMQLLESLASEGVTEEEIIAARNKAAMDFYTPQEAFYGFGGRGDLLNLGMMYGDDPLLLYELYDHQQTVTSADIQRVASRYLIKDNQLVVSAVPMGKRPYAVQP